MPEADLRRRFLPGLRNFFSLYLPLADEALLFDALDCRPQLIAQWQGPKARVINRNVYEQIQSQIKNND